MSRHSLWESVAHQLKSNGLPPLSTPVRRIETSFYPRYYPTFADEWRCHSDNDYDHRKADSSFITKTLQWSLRGVIVCGDLEVQCQETEVLYV